MGRLVKLTRNDRYNMVILISKEGKKLGETSLEDSLQKAEEEGMDLVLVKEDPSLPICRIMDSNKEKFKKTRKKPQKRTKTKEVKFNMTIAEHDLSIKAKHIDKILEKGNRVRIVVKPRRRSLEVRNAEEKVEHILDLLSFPFRRDTEIKSDKYSCFVNIAPSSH